MIAPSMATADDTYAALGYAPQRRVDQLIDAYTYVADGQYFLTQDGRMGVAWRLPSISGDALSDDVKSSFATAIARVIDLYPEGSSGQYFRFHHRDVADRLNRFRSGTRQHGFFPTVADSVCSVQERGAAFSFLADAKDAAPALEKLRQMRRDGDDGSALGAPVEWSRAGITRGTIALVTEQYLIFCLPSSLARKVGIGRITRDIGNFLRGTSPDALIRRVGQEERTFLDHAEELEHQMQSLSIDAQRLDRAELTQLLYRIMNPRRAQISGAPLVSGFETIADALRLHHIKPSIAVNSTACNLQTSQEGWLLDGYHHFATSVRAMPEETRAPMLEHALDMTEGEGWVTINWSIPTQTWYRLNLKLKATMLNNQRELAHIPLLAPDPMKMQKREEDLVLVGNATNPEEREYNKVVNASVHIICRDTDKARALRRSKQLEKHLWNAGNREVLRGEAIIHHSLPFNFRPESRPLIRRDFPILSTNLCDLLPLYTGFGGLDDGRLLLNNTRGEPIPWDFISRHVTAGHTLITGGTGTGKSFLVNGIVTQCRTQRPTKTFVIDKGFNFNSACEAAGGQTIVLVAEEQNGHKPICINPYWIDDSGGHRQPNADELTYMIGCTVAMLKAGTADEDGKTEPVPKVEMNALLLHLKSVFNRRKHGEEIMLRHLLASLRSNPDDGLACSLAARLQDFSSDGGIWGAIFDGPLAVNWDAEMIVLETSLMADKAAMDVVMLALFAQIESYVKHKLPRNQHKLMIIDESWKVLAKRHLASLMSGFFREMRKYTCAIALISQAVSDFTALVRAEGNADDGILTNTRHFFMLGAQKSDMDEAKTLFNITPEDLALWASAKSRMPIFTEFFYLLRHRNNQDYAQLLRYYADPVTYWMTTSDGTDFEIRRTRAEQIRANTNCTAEVALQNAIINLAKEMPYGQAFTTVQ